MCIMSVRMQPDPFDIIHFFLVLFPKGPIIQDISFFFPLYFYVFNFLFCIEVQLIINVVIISGRQQRSSIIQIHASILPQAPLPSRLPHNIEQSSLCYTVGPCWLSILNTAVCTCPSQTPYLFPSPSSFTTLNSFSESESFSVL